MSQTERIYYLTRKLREGFPITLQGVASYFEISTRQVSRDIEYLRERIGVEIKYDTLRHCYFLVDATSLGDDMSEYKALITQSIVGSLLGQMPLGSYIKREVKDSLAETISPDSRAVLDKIIYHAPKVDLPSFNIFSKVVASISENKALKIDYLNAQLISSSRVVEPLRLINYSSIWYLICYDHLHENLRTFLLSRIQSLEISDEPLVYSDKEELSSYIDDGFGIFLSGKLESYVIKFKGNSAFTVKNEIWHEKQTIKVLDDNSVLLTLPAKQPYELVGKLLSYAGDAIPIAPPCFVEEFSRCLKRLNSSFEINS